uniref:SMO1-2 n=1 Tax=Arundo donax TaxID=35708 RepID=A0A0A9HB27_ARUDO
MTTFWLWFVIRHIEAIDTPQRVPPPIQPNQVYPLLRWRRVRRLPSLRRKADPEQLRFCFHIL